jgi:hypothetical protein
VTYRLRVRAAAALLLFSLAFPAAAQGPFANPPRPPDPASRSRALQALERSSARDASRRNEARVTENNQRELDGRLAEFANSWNKLMGLAEKGVWNAKQAKKTREAFERLIKAQGWIEDKALTASR